VLALGILAATFDSTAVVRSGTHRYLFMALLLGSAWCVRFAERKLAFRWRSLFCLAFLPSRRLPSLVAWRLERGPCVDFDVRSGSPARHIAHRRKRALLNLWTGGWYWYYAFMCLRPHDAAGVARLRLLAVETLGQLLSPRSPSSLCSPAPRRHPPRPWLFYLLFCSCQLMGPIWSNSRRQLFE